MDKGYLCGGCGDRESEVYCKECGTHFCKECDAYLHTGAKVYSGHTRESIAGKTKEKPDAALSQDVEKMLATKREIDEKIQRVKADYADLSAKSVQKSREFLEQSLGAYLRALQQVKTEAEDVLREARARKAFLESIEDERDDGDAEDRAALIAIARTKTTASIEQRLVDATKAIDTVTTRYANVKFAGISEASSSEKAAQMALGALLEGKDGKEDLIYDDHFFPTTFGVLLDFGIKHVADAATKTVKLTWNVPELLKPEKPHFLLELRNASSDARYQVCYNGDALECTLSTLRAGNSYHVRVTALCAASKERLPYASAPYTITIKKKEKKEIVSTDSGSSKDKNGTISKKTFYEGIWANPSGDNSGYVLVEDGFVVKRDGNLSGDYVASVCNLPLATAAGVATAWTFQIEDINPDTHLYMGLRPVGAEPVGVDKGYYFCATCGALKSKSLDHVGVPECQKGSVKKGAKIGMEFSSDGKKGCLSISVNRIVLSMGICNIPLDVPFVPAIVCKFGEVRIVA